MTLVVKATPCLIIVDIMVILEIVYLNENNVEYLYQVNVFAKELYLLFGIESLFKADVKWYHVTVKKNHFSTVKKIKKCNTTRSLFVCTV